MSLSHLDTAVCRVLPLLLWRHRDRLDWDRLVQEATRRDERQALGCFLELAGLLGRDPRLTAAAQPLRDRRRTKPRMFFAGPRGPRAMAATRRTTPKEALSWGYLMNIGVDGFRTTFDEFGRT